MIVQRRLAILPLQIKLLLNIAALLSAAWVIPITSSAQIERLAAESPITFDSRGRVAVLTPRVAQSAIKGATWWPGPAESWREARLYALSSADSAAGIRNGRGFSAILEITQDNGTVVRYGLGSAELTQLRLSFDGGVPPATGGRSAGTMSGVELSQPAGYTFVRNQTLLGLAAYGPATAASLSKQGSTSAAGGYFLAAGASFFVSAQMIRTRIVTRSQTILGTHAGFRGGLAGAAIAGIAQADDGPGFGVPILIGALGGTVGGFLAAKNMSDGEAASAGLISDMFSLSALGVGRMTQSLNAPRHETKQKVALGAAVGMAGLGYLVGPQYARRSHYNVTAGDASVAFTGALIGAAAAASIADVGHKQEVAAGLGTAGLIAGFIASDRLLVRKYDRSSSDAGWAKLGAVAGALLGGGVAVISKVEGRGTLGLVAVGAATGLITADRMIGPARDAGPLRGVLRTSSLLPSDSDQQRVQLMLPSAATAFVLWNGRRASSVANSVRIGGPISNFPAVRFVF